MSKKDSETEELQELVQLEEGVETKKCPLIGADILKSQLLCPRRQSSIFKTLFLKNSNCKLHL